MESPRQTRKLMGRLLLLLLLVLTAWGWFAQNQSEAATALAAKENRTLYVALLTQPAMVAAFNPAARKAVITTVKRKKTPKDPIENAQDLFQKSAASPRQVRYYIPTHTNRNDYWDQFKNKLTGWRFNPVLAVQTLGSYIQARKERRTNLSAAEFLLYALELSRMEMTDFTVSNTGDNNKKKKSAAKETKELVIPAPSAEAETDRPLILEILNASGKKGAAKELTQYLRDKNQKGLLHVDILNQDNFPGGRQKETRIIDYAGRLEQVKQLSTAIGVNSEVSSEKQENPLYDVRIIIGEDFKQPL